MLDKLKELAKSQLVPALIDDPDVDNAKAEEIAQVSGETVLSALSQQLQGGDYSGIMELLSGNDSDTSSPAVNNLSPQLAENLISKLGLSPELARGIAARVLPLILNMLNGKVQNAQSQGIDIGSILAGLAGGSNGQGGGLLGKLGGLFGAKKDHAAAGNREKDLSDLLGNIL